MNIDKTLERLEGVRAYDGYWQACCPAHDDQNPSLSIAEGDYSGILVYCSAGCAAEDITSASEPPPERRGRGP